MSAVLIALATFLAVVAFPAIYRLFRHLYYARNLQGPALIPIIGNSHHFALNGTEGWVKFLIRESDKVRNNGEGFMRFWNMRHLFVFPVDGASSKDILDSLEEITKGDSYDFMEEWLGTGLLISTNEKWKTRRRMLTPTFHFTMLDSYMKTFGIETDILIDCLDQVADTHEEIDLFPYIKRCALDIICGTAMGKTYEAQKNVNHPYVLAVTEITTMAMVYVLSPWLWIAPVWHALGYAKKKNDLLHTLKSFTLQVIKERQEEIEEFGFEHREGKKAFLDMLLEMKGQNQLSDEDIREEVDTFMFEGHDTTSSGIAFVLWTLAHHQDIQQKVYEEILEVMGPHGEITVQNIKQLSYLERVIKESLRMFPPVPIVQRKLMKDFKTGKYFFPQGVQLVLSPLILHYNEKAFPDPYKFDPDRFLPENLEKRNAYDYIPFSAGPRNCIGQKFAMMEEKTVVASVIRNFKLTATLPFLDNIPCTEVVLKPIHGVPVKLQKRM
ncbi:unnamed protein product [Auanema sp. JU1783]|nr:unnamed protein product [Auanema sp. JU1783]